MTDRRFRVRVVVERKAVANRWIEAVCGPAAVAIDDSPTASTTPHAEDPALGAQVPAVVEQSGTRTAWSYPGFEIALHRSEAEGYYLNVNSPQPSAFVMWRLEDGLPKPVLVTASYNEAARWLDGGEQVDRVPLPAEIAAALADWVAANYRAEPRPKLKRNDPFTEDALRRARK